MAQAKNALSAADLIGAWRLVKIESIGTAGVQADVSSFGARPEGLIIYDAAGWMSVQIQLDRAPAGSPDGIAHSENYSAYCGTWTFDPQSQTVSHRIHWATFPRKRGDVLRRVVSGDLHEVSLTTEEPFYVPGGTRSRLTWARLTSPD